MKVIFILILIYKKMFNGLFGNKVRSYLTNEIF